MDREAWRAAIHGVAKSRHNWATDLIGSDLRGQRKSSRASSSAGCVLYQLISLCTAGARYKLSTSQFLTSKMRIILTITLSYRIVMIIKVTQYLNYYYYLIRLTEIYPKSMVLQIYLEVGCLENWMLSFWKTFQVGTLSLSSLYFPSEIPSGALQLCLTVLALYGSHHTVSSDTYKEVAFSCLKCLKSSILPTNRESNLLHMAHRALYNLALSCS